MYFYFVHLKKDNYVNRNKITNHIGINSNINFNIFEFMRYKHVTGIEGVFVRFYKNRFGDGMVIKLDNGKEYFAPINEFKLI